MIFKKYGTTLHSVDVNFDARAMNEIGFRRNREEELPIADLESAHTLVEIRELTAEASGAVQDEAEQALLAKLEASLRAFEAELDGSEFLLIESDANDYPKTRDEKSHRQFNWRVDPPLRVGRYRRND